LKQTLSVETFANGKIFYITRAKTFANEPY